MIIYNTTFCIERDVLSECIEYLKWSYIPRAASGGFLISPRLHRILGGAQDEEAVSYSVQFRVKNQETLAWWLETEGQVLQQELVARFGAKVAGFSTLLEEISLER